MVVGRDDLPPSRRADQEVAVQPGFELLAQNVQTKFVIWTVTRRCPKASLNISPTENGTALTDSDPLAPAKRGEDTPVPKDVATQRFQRVEDREPQDELVPMSYVEQRAEERSQQPRPLLYVQDDEPARVSDVENPLAGEAPLPAQSTRVGNPMGMPVGYGQMPAYMPYGSTPQLAYTQGAVQPMGYPTQMYQLSPGQGYMPQYNPYGIAYQPMMYPGYAPAAGSFGPQLEVWSKKRKRVALWSSFLQQTLAALALHVFVIGGLFLAIASQSWNDFADGSMADGPASFTGFMVWLSHPDRVWMSILMLLMVTGALFAGAYWIGMLMQKNAGIVRGRHKAFWLAGISGGGITVIAWPIVYFVTWFVLLLMIMIDGQGFGGIWIASFTVIVLASVVHGFYSMAFSRMFLHGARPPIDFNRLAQEAEARARAEDEARMTRPPGELPGD